MDSTDPQQAVRWSLADLIDYELFLDEDAAADFATLAERDEGIRKDLTRSLPEADLEKLRTDTPHHRRWWLHRWLVARRAMEKTVEESAGIILENSLSQVAFLVTAMGAGLGLSSLFGLLAAPKVIDVWGALLIYLGPQLLLLCLTLWGFVRQRWGLGSPTRPILLRLLGKGIGRLWLWWGSKIEDLAQDQSILFRRYEAGISLLLSRGKLRSKAFGWPLLQLLQRAGMAFAGSIALGMFVICVFSHFNFGWGSSWDKMNPEVIHRAVRTIASPWSWLFPEGVGYPRLEEVVHSQTFKDQSLPADFPRLSSWWIFLCLSLFTWAFLPRLLLFFYSGWKGKRVLAEEGFRDRRSERLYLRLAEPTLRWKSPATGGEEAEEASLVTKAKTASRAARSPNPGAETVPPSHCEVFTELSLSEADRERITARIEDRLRLGVTSFQPVYTPAEQEAALARLSGLRWADDTPRVILLYRASDPIVASLRNLTTRCLEAIGITGHLIIVLVGKRDLLNDPADPEDIEVWAEFSDRLKRKNPNVEIEKISSPKS